MSNEYPKMLYRFGGEVEIDGDKFTTLIVDDSEAADAALADKWFETASQSKQAAADEKAAADAALAQQVVNDEAPPTRDELERKARELEIKFDGRTGDKKLAHMIAAALES